MGESALIAKARYALLLPVLGAHLRPLIEAPRHKPFALPQELRKGARNIQFVLEHQSDPPPPSTPVRLARSAHAPAHRSPGLA